MAEGDRVAVYDLGGGTFDAAVLVPDGAGFRLAGPPEGVEQLGGIDFDEAVFRHVLTSLGPEVADLDDTDPATATALARLRRDCVEAKEVLSFSIDTVVPVALPGITRSIRLTRGDLDDMLRPAIGETVAATRRVLDSAGVDPGDLAAIVLVGGSSRIPLVSEMLSAEFGRPLALDNHPKHDVALGAAIRGTAAARPAAARPAPAPAQTGALRWRPHGGLRDRPRDHARRPGGELDGHRHPVRHPGGRRRGHRRRACRATGTSTGTVAGLAPALDRRPDDLARRSHRADGPAAGRGHGEAWPNADRYGRRRRRAGGRHGDRARHPQGRTGPVADGRAVADPDLRARCRCRSPSRWCRRRSRRRR